MPRLDTDEVFHDLFGMLGITYPDTNVLIAPYDDLEPGVPHPQRMAIETIADETFYGGAAGGGKSYLLLILALRYFYNSIIYRRQKNEIEAFYLESRQILLDTRAQYNKNKHVWDDIPGGRRLEFGGVQHEKDVQAYMGRPHDFVAFDEITNFPESVYRFLSIWCRTARPNHRPRIVVTGNPPTTEEGEWVIRYWRAWLDEEHPNPAKPGELRWYAMDGDEEIELLTGDLYTRKTDGKQIKPRSRTFIPAKVEHNLELMRNGYASQLDGLPTFLRDRYRDGNFHSKRDDPEDQCIPTSYILEAQALWHGLGKPDPETKWIAGGLDVARGGQDDSVFAPFDGQRVGNLIIVPGKYTPTGAKTVDAFSKYLNRDMKIYVDANTWGADAQQQLKAAGYKSIPINVSSGTKEKDETGKFEFFNLRSQLYWRLREYLSPRAKVRLALPPDRQLLIELCAFKFEVANGKIRLEDKASVKARLGKSPDRADAVVLALRHYGRRSAAGVLHW